MVGIAFVARFVSGTLYSESMVVLQLTLVLLIFLGLVLFLQARFDAQRFRTSTTAELTGLCTMALDRTARRQQNLTYIRQLLRTHPTLANREIRDQLAVSSRTVVRYMNELIERGEVEQVGEIGADVVYRLKV